MLRDSETDPSLAQTHPSIVSLLQDEQIRWVAYFGFTEWESSNGFPTQQSQTLYQRREFVATDAP